MLDSQETKKAPREKEVRKPGRLLIHTKMNKLGAFRFGAIQYYFKDMKIRASRQ